MLNFEWFCIMWIYALQWNTTSYFEYLELLCDCTELCKCCRLTDCVYSQCESGDYGFSVQTNPQRLVVCSPYITLAVLRQGPLNLDKDRNYCNVNKSNTIPAFAPGALLVARLSKFKHVRTSSWKRFLSLFSPDCCCFLFSPGVVGL